MSSWTGSVFLWIFLLSGDFGILDERLAMHFACLFQWLIVWQLPLFSHSSKCHFRSIPNLSERKNTDSTARLACDSFIDLLKSLVLSLALGVPLLYLVFWLYQVAGSSWWIWAFATLFGFQFVIAAVYPTLLAPIFNKFTPLGEGTLKEKIEKSGTKNQFQNVRDFYDRRIQTLRPLKCLFCRHGKNAPHCSFDTLTQQLTEPEMISVLGHEMGHNKLKHVQKQMILSFVVSFIGFWALSKIMNSASFLRCLSGRRSRPSQSLGPLRTFFRNFHVLAHTDF